MLAMCQWFHDHLQSFYLRRLDCTKMFDISARVQEPVGNAVRCVQLYGGFAYMKRVKSPGQYSYGMCSIASDADWLS